MAQRLKFHQLYLSFDLNISKYPIYRLINDDEIIAKTEVVDGIILLHNPMLIDVSFNDEGRLEVRMMPYTIYTTTIKVFQDSHVLMAVEAPEEIIEIYNNSILNRDESDEQSTENSNIEIRILH